MDGVNVSGRIVGEVNIDKELNAAAVAVFVLRPDPGVIDPYTWTRAKVSITFVNKNSSGVVTYKSLKFKGIVDTPEYNPNTRLITFTCTDDLQNKVRALSRAQIDALTPKSVWSKLRYSEEVDGWDYLQQRLETYPYSIELDNNSKVVSREFAVSAIALEFNSSVIFDQSVSVKLANARDLVNKITLNASYSYPQYRETVVEVNWTETDWFRPVFPNWAYCSVQMICDAVAGSEASFVTDPLFNLTPASQFRHLNGQLYAHVNPGAELLAIEFRGVISKRYKQDITNVVSLVLQSDASIESVGVIEESEDTSMSVELDPIVDEAFSYKDDFTKYLCTAGSGLTAGRDSDTNTLQDPNIPVNGGFIKYPKLPFTYSKHGDGTKSGIVLDDYNHFVPSDEVGQHLKTYKIGGFISSATLPGEHVYDFQSFATQGTQQDREDTLAVDKARITTRILSSHRQNKIGFSTFILPDLHRGHTYRVDTETLKATGPVFQLIENYDIDGGSASCNIVLAVSSVKAIGLANPSPSIYRVSVPVTINSVSGHANPNDIAVPVNMNTFSYLVTLGSHYHTGTIDSAWEGHIAPTGNASGNEFSIVFPSIPDDNTQNTTLNDQVGVLSVDVPQDELIITV